MSWLAARGGGMGHGQGQAPGPGGSLALSCTLGPPPAANIVNIDGRAGQFGQMYQFPVPPGNLEIIIVPGAGGGPVMLGAGAGGPGGPNSNGVQLLAAGPGYVLFGW